MVVSPPDLPTLGWLHDLTSDDMDQIFDVIRFLRDVSGGLFYAVQTVAQSISNDVDDYVDYTDDAEVIDAAGGHSTTGGGLPDRYVPQATGWHLAFGCVGFEPNGNGHRSAWLEISASAPNIKRGRARIPAVSGAPTWVATGPALVHIPVAGTGFISLGFRQTSGGSLNTTVASGEGSTLLVVRLGRQ